ncbi:hypothetical protein DY000_02058537 [Brassica cretica]|uniref:Uncharacterized protein n=1 Tax=Brassica cretica TaxID=69181 RepID=A0ABQ7AU93_BRACR|nr:hypothetical protein DY000_02058537 [Brassica cretica]
MRLLIKHLKERFFWTPVEWALERVLPSGLEELGGFGRWREVVGDLTVVNSDEGLCICTETECDRFLVDNMKDFASDLERDLDELCKNEKHHTQLKEETLSHREGWQRTRRKQKWSKSRRFKFKINPEEQLGSCLTFSGHSLKDDCTENEACPT